jgi:PilZ domain-containing protein
MANDELETDVDHEERRHYDRSRLIVDVHFDGTDATGVASTKDISAGGLYMNTQAKLLEGSVLMIRIPLGSGKQLVARAEVVYANPGCGVGLRFQGLSDEDGALLDAEIANS